MVTHSKQSPIELAFTLLRSLDWYLSHIWNIWCQIYQISYKIIFITKELTKNTIVFFKKPLKSKFKISKVEKEEELGRNIFGIERHSNKKTLNTSFYVSRILKNNLKTNNFSHVIEKAIFTTYFLPKTKKYAFLSPPIFPNTKKFISRKYHQNWYVLNT